MSNSKRSAGDGLSWLEEEARKRRQMKQAKNDTYEQDKKMKPRLDKKENQNDNGQCDDALCSSTQPLGDY